jgi:ADP-heptose:LPS heptosyltransferase
MSKVLIIRLSAIGDVAITIPVVYAVAKDNPQDSFTMLTQTFLKPLFVNPPSNLTVIGIDTKTTEKSLAGFLRYAWMLRNHHFDIVIDLHNVIRSWLVDFIFRLSGKKIYIVDKYRKEKRQLTSRPPKTIRPLRPVIERYADVFRKAGFRFEIKLTSLFSEHTIDKTDFETLFGTKKGRWIGIAPFARHKGKIYPLEKMEQVVKVLSEQSAHTIFLIGSAGEEEALLERWEQKYSQVINVANRRLSLDKVLALISMLDVMVCMDSANMHFSSLVDTDVISIWGATHPYLGFNGYRRREDLSIQVDLPCRPCSGYGAKPCYRGDWVCLNRITPEQIISKINDYLNVL